MTDTEYRNIERGLRAASDVIRERRRLSPRDRELQGDIEALIAKVIAAKYRAESPRKHAS